MGQFLNTMFDAYCYGPADILRVSQGDSSMWLSLLDSVSRQAVAIYQGCVYWPLIRAGLHLSLVQQVSAEQLIRRHDSPALLVLYQNTSHVEKLLQEWEAAGLHLFLHSGSFPEREFLVAAKSLSYREAGI